MLTIQQLREKRKELAIQAHQLLDNTTGAFTAEQDAKYADLLKGIDDCDADIKKIQDLLDREADTTGRDKDRADRLNISVDEAHQRREMDKAIFNAWIRGGSSELTKEQAEHLRAKQQEARKVYGALAVGTDSAGGFTVPTDFAGMLLERLKRFGGVREVATNITTEHGRDIEYPTSDGTTELGELIAENVTATELDASFGVATLKAYKWSSKFIAVPFELLQDTMIDLEAFLLQRLTTRIGRSQGVFFTTGTGTAQPQGVVTAAGTVAAAGATAITYDDLVNLQHAVDPAYRLTGNMAFMLHDNSLAIVRKLKDSQGRPIWEPNVQAGQPATLLGERVVINQHMAASVVATAKSVLFGDFSQYTVRDVMAVQLFRFTDSAFVKLGQVGFLAWTRADGRVMAHTAADVMKVLLH